MKRNCAKTKDVFPKYEILKKGESTRKNIQKQQLKVLERHHKIGIIRADYSHETIAEIVKTKPSYIRAEDLNVSGMIQDRYLSKIAVSLLFFEFRIKLKFKCDEIGNEARFLINGIRFQDVSLLRMNQERLKTFWQNILLCVRLCINTDFNVMLNLGDAGTYEDA